MEVFGIDGIYEKKQTIYDPSNIKKYTVVTNRCKDACKNYKHDSKSNLLLKCQNLHIFAFPQLVLIANFIILKSCK